MIARSGNVKIAMQSIKAAKWRSFMTMLGVIIGVLSVVTTVSLGEGVKQQIRQQGTKRGEDLLTVLPGQRVERDDAGNIIQVNPFGATGTVFAEADYKAVQKVKEVGKTAPLARVSGLAETDNNRFRGQIIATSAQLPSLLNQKIGYGRFFDDTDQDSDFAVIGTRVAEELFGENVPMGKSFRVRNQTFIVRGIFDEFPSSGPLLQESDYNNTIFIPYEVGRELMGGTIPIQQVLAKPAANSTATATAKLVRGSLLDAHAGQEDFTVLTQAETLVVTSSVLNLLTAMITGIAAISLFVGGIGIMNIMFVSVTERTSEIGIRKAVGATNRQILAQFLTEASLLALVGGLLGVILSLIVNFLLRVLTDLQPVITLPIMGIAVGVSLLVGVIFGVTPAWRAAHKDPIEALRYQ